MIYLRRGPLLLTYNLCISVYISLSICKMKTESAFYIFVFLSILLIGVHFYKVKYPTQKHIVPDELSWLKFKIDLNKLIPV